MFFTAGYNSGCGMWYTDAKRLCDARGGTNVAKSPVRRRRLLRIIGGVCVILLSLYVLLCEVGFFRGVPVEPPDRITVYRDGQSAVFDR